MTRGARDFGEIGCFGEADLVLFDNEIEELWGCWLPWVILASAGALVLSVNRAVSAFSSSAGPDMQASMLSPKTCCRQLFPGALIDRSCSGGRPGIVAIRRSLISSSMLNTFVMKGLTRIHGDLLHRSHRTEFWHADLSSPDKSLLLGLQPKSRAE
jgi:hypothetical protein